MMIEAAEPDDLDAIRVLLDRCDLPHTDLTPAHLQHFLVARSEAGLQGAVGIEPRGDAALLRSLAVAPAARDRGLGACLVDAAEEAARRQDSHAIYLLTTTAADYFAAHGYERIERSALPPPIQETEEARCLCPESATTMRKALRTAAAEN